MINKFLLCVLFCMPALALGADCETLAKLEASTYNFRPSQVTKQQRTTKSNEMDTFWERAKGSPDCVAELLRKEKDGSFFLFDGAALLMEEAPSKENAQLAADSILRSNFEDIDVAGFISMYLRLNRTGADVGRLAQAFLKQQKVQGYVPQHSLTIDRTVAAMFLFGSLSAEQNDRYLLPLISDLNQEVRESAIYMATASMTQASFQALATLDRSKLPKELNGAIDSVLLPRRTGAGGTPKYTREQILAKLRKFPEMDSSDFEEGEAKEIDRSLVLTLQKEDVPLLREARARSFAGLSDESLYRYKDMTNLLISVINHLELYKDVRQSGHDLQTH
jgi:hypothetical protein